MVSTSIYITTDSRSPKATEKYYGYIVEGIARGETKTKEGFGKIDGTYNQAVLAALAEALDRYHGESEIHIHTENEFVLNMLSHNLENWARNSFLTSKGKPVANREEWQQVWEQLQKHNHILVMEPGKHSYIIWIRDEIEKRKEQENV